MISIPAVHIVTTILQTKFLSLGYACYLHFSSSPNADSPAEIKMLPMPSDTLLAGEHLVFLAKSGQPPWTLPYEKDPSTSSASLPSESVFT